MFTDQDFGIYDIISYPSRIRINVCNLDLIFGKNSLVRRL